MIKNKIVEILPILRKIRKCQRLIYFYCKLMFKKIYKKYSEEKSNKKLQFEVYNCKSNLINYNSNFNIEYQYNKIENLEIASKYINNLIIKPGEIFSFWNIIGVINKTKGYKEGMCLVNGKYIPDVGGGICQLTNLLFFSFLHTPLTIIERHGHKVQETPYYDSNIPFGTDAAVSEGWFDLVIENDSNTTYQIVIEFDDQYIKCKILSDKENKFNYKICSVNGRYLREDGKLYYNNEMYKKITDKNTNKVIEYNLLYTNKYEIKYDLNINQMLLL